MAIPLSDEIKALLDAPNFAHLATLMPDGSPQSVPVWVGREGDRILICTGEGSLKAKNTRRDPRVALSIVDFRDPYLEVQLRGRVVGHLPDAGFLPARRAVRDSLTNGISSCISTRRRADKRFKRSVASTRKPFNDIYKKLDTEFQSALHERLARRKVAQYPDQSQ